MIRSIVALGLFIAAATFGTRAESAEQSNRVFVLQYGDGLTATPDQLDQVAEILKERLRLLDRNILIGRVKNQVWVRLPDSESLKVEAVRRELKRRNLVEFRLVHTDHSSPQRLLPPEGYELMIFETELRGHSFKEPLWIKRGAELSNHDIEEAFPVIADRGTYEVIVSLTANGRAKFASLTRSIAESSKRDGAIHRLAIMLDGVILSAPAIRETIDSDRISITGKFSEREALELANMLSVPLALPPILEEKIQ